MKFLKQLPMVGQCATVIYMGRDSRVHEEYLGAAEVAEILGVSRVTVWRRVKRGELIPEIQRDSGRRESLFTRAQVDELLLEQQKAS